MRVELNALMFLDEVGKRGLTNQLNFVEFLQDFAVVNGFIEQVELFGVPVPYAAANRPVNQVGKFGIRAH